ncbi:MAG: flagellar biosynthetic protein FliO [Planctomycetota bacterium]
MSFSLRLIGPLVVGLLWPLATLSFAEDARPLGTPEALRLPPRDDATASGGREGLMGRVSSLGPLAAVLAASAGVLISLKLWQKYGGGPAGVAPVSATELLGRTAVGPRQHVVLLRVGRRVLVLAQADGALSTLAEIDQPEEVATLLDSFGPNAARPVLPAGFGDRLDQAVAPPQSDRRPAGRGTGEGTAAGPARSAEQALADRLRIAAGTTRTGGRRVA